MYLFQHTGILVFVMVFNREFSVSSKAISVFPKLRCVRMNLLILISGIVCLHGVFVRKLIK